MAPRVLVAAVIACAGPAAWPDRAAACDLAAAVAGDDSLARAIAADLARHGIERDAPPGCPVIVVQVTARDGGILLSLTGHGGAVAERSIGEVGTAAMVIASFAAALALPLPAPVAIVERAPAAPRSPGPALGPGGLAIRYELGRDDHARLWHGLALAGCVSVGPLCLGGLGRLVDHLTTAPRSPRTPTDRGGSGYDLVATAALPFSIGPIVVAPELAAGLGHLRYEWHYDLERFESHSDGVRFGARVTATAPIGAGFAFEVGLGFDALPARHLRFDVALPPLAERDANATLRAAVGLRHGWR